jgi:hypothetical protein
MQAIRAACHAACSKHPQLAPADSKAVIIGEDGETYLSMPERFGYSLLRMEVLGGDYFSQSWHQPVFHAVRSDGMRFTGVGGHLRSRLSSQFTAIRKLSDRWRSSLVFSSSSCFGRRISETPIPAYTFFQR